MTPIEKDKIVALCEKWGLKELNFTKGLYLAGDGTGITVNLRGDGPLVGVTIAGEFHTEGHGNLKVEDYQREVEAIMKQEASPFFQSSSIDKPKSTSNIADLQPAGKPKIFKRDATPTKLGTPETSVVQSGQRAEILEIPGFNSPTAPTPKLQKAKCKECHTEFNLTLDAAQKIFEKYGGIYCMKCRSKEAKHEKKEVTNEEKKGSDKVMETKINSCIVCGVELSGARTLECFERDIQKPVMICEDCEEKKTNGEKKMNEKLPAINENKLTVTENKLTIAVIKQYICPTATDAEAYNFLQLCVHRDLNPFLKEAYLIKYGAAPATMVVGKDAFTKKAEESGMLDGFEAGIIIKTSDGRIDRRVGVIQYEGDILVGGWAKIFRKDMKYPFVCEVPLTEYMKYKDGKPQSSWAIMPGTMIRKVALVQALREAFARELGGCYDAVEMGTQDNLK